MKAKMTESAINSSITLDKRNPLEDGTWAVAIKVSASRNDDRKYRIGYSYSDKEFATLKAGREKQPYKDIWDTFEAERKRAQSIIDSLMPCFSFPAFKERWDSKPTATIITDRSSLGYICEVMVNEYLASDQLPTSEIIKQAVRSLLIFTQTDNIPLRAITPSFCREYEAYMVAKSKKSTVNGAAMNLGHIRVLYNEAIRKGLVPVEWYPFMRQQATKSIYDKLYTIPRDKKKKDHLKEKELVKFAAITKFKTERQKQAHIAWMISYHCNGANPADYLQFKFNQISNNVLTYYREKVKNGKRRTRQLVKFFITEELWELIRLHGNEPAPGNYIFKCYNEGMTKREMYDTRKVYTSDFSQSLKFVARDNGISTNIRIGNARHSVSNVRKKNGVDREFIKDALGHAVITTTDEYLESFEDEMFEQVEKQVSSLSAVKKRVNWETETLRP